MILQNGNLFVHLFISGWKIFNKHICIKKKKSGWDVEHKIQTKRETLLNLLSIPSAIKTHANNFTTLTSKKKKKNLVFWSNSMRSWLSPWKAARITRQQTKHPLPQLLLPQSKSTHKIREWRPDRTSGKPYPLKYRLQTIMRKCFQASGF